MFSCGSGGLKEREREREREREIVSEIKKEKQVKCATLTTQETQLDLDKRENKKGNKFYSLSHLFCVRCGITGA